MPYNVHSRRLVYFPTTKLISPLLGRTPDLNGDRRPHKHCVAHMQVYVHTNTLYSDRDTVRNDANQRAGHRVSKVSRSLASSNWTYARSQQHAGVTLGVSERAYIASIKTPALVIIIGRLKQTAARQMRSVYIDVKCVSSNK